MSNFIPYSFQLSSHNLCISFLSLPRGFISFRAVLLSQQAPLRISSNLTLDRNKDVLAPASLSTYRQQQKHLKQVIPETPVPNSESTIPGCREAVLMCLWLLSLSARAEVNITLASLDLVQLLSEPQLWSHLGSLTKDSEAWKCPAEDKLRILASLLLLMMEKSKQVRQKWPKWLMVKVISTPNQLTAFSLRINPALLMSISSCENLLVTCSAKSSTDLLLERSSSKLVIQPLELGREAMMDLTASVFLAVFLLPMMMRWPSAQSSRAVSSPMPELPPVMTMFLVDWPFSSNISGDLNRNKLYRKIHSSQDKYLDNPKQQVLCILSNERWINECLWVD